MLRAVSSNVRLDNDISTGCREYRAGLRGISEEMSILGKMGRRAVLRTIRQTASCLAIGMALVTGGRAWGAEHEPRTQQFDVVVYGATAGGVMAATAAGQMGMKVALVEPGRHVGGMVSGGLSHSDVDRQEELIGGLAMKFFDRVAKYYGTPKGWSFEPHVAEDILRQFLSDAHVQLFQGERVSEVRHHGAEIRVMETADGHQFAGKIFIDSSYEGDLMKAAGVSYVIGREGRSKYDESLAGRMELLPAVHQFATSVSSDGLIEDNLPPASAHPRITKANDVVPTGEGDGRFQSYCYRLILTDNPSNRLPIEKPVAYDPANYELLKRYIQSNPGLKLKGILGLNRIPNGKADANSNGPVSLDFLGANLGYPDGTPEVRKQIAEAHLRWAQGLVYFLQNDPSVPQPLQEQARQWGLPKDEFGDTGHWPNQLYVREGRRMLGEYVLTQSDLQQHRTKPDAIGISGYNIDIREVQWISHPVYWFPSVRNQVFTEGYMSQPVDPWQIPLRALLPKEREASNLLVTSCISASTVAYASYRVEPTYMVAGESSGVAAALAIQSKTNLHHLEISRLQALLRERGQILSAGTKRLSGGSTQ